MNIVLLADEMHLHLMYVIDIFDFGRSDNKHLDKV